MGKLRIEGRASKEYEYDVMEITICFRSYETSSKKAIQTMTEQCEAFLSTLNEHGISLEHIRVGNDSIRQEYDGQKERVVATREIIMRLPFAVSSSNHLMELLSTQKYDVDFNIKPILSNDSEIRNELIKLALEDSKNKALSIANLMGQKIIGIDMAEIGKQYQYRSGLEDCFYVAKNPLAGPVRLQLSNQLKVPTTTETETIEVVWLIEE